MSFFDVLILDTILILFPLISVVLIKASIKNVTNADKDCLIDLANFTSMFLLIKYCDLNNAYSILLVNMPFVISALYKRRTASLFLSLALTIFNISLGFNYLLIITEYLLLTSSLYILSKRKSSNSTILLMFVFIKGIFLTIYEYYFLDIKGFGSIVQIIISLTIFYLVGILIIEIMEQVKQFVALNQTLKELEKEKQLKNSLFKITHEVKNPISVCKGYLSMMDYSDVEKIKGYNEIILGELNRTLDIMDNFSMYTKINVNLDIMDLDYLIEDTINNFKLLFDNHNVKINYTSIDELYINGDYDRLKQVLVNIFKNSVEADAKNIDLSIKEDKKNIVLDIKDDGHGICKEDLNKIDELFYTSKEKGCGIGVSLSKEIVRLHNGFIKYKSKEGKYTIVSIKLPKIVNNS